MTNEKMLNEQEQSTFTLDGVGKLPTLEFRVHADGAVEFATALSTVTTPASTGIGV